MDINRRPIGTQKPPADYYLGWINKIAAAANVEISEATQAVYLQSLMKLSASQIRQAAERTISEWNKPSQMPPVPFIAERAYSPEPERYKLPSFRQLAENARVTREEIEEWLLAGKEAQREYYAELEADPQWRAEAKRLGVKL